MNGTRAIVVRGGLVFLTAISALLGVVIFVWPAEFFGLSWVNMGMAYNPHLLLDYGAKNLAVAVFLGGAAVSMHRVLVRTALAGYAVWAVAHFLIHLRYRAHFAAHASAAEANLLVAILGVGALIPLVLLVLTYGRREARKQNAVADPPT
ncbi:hypothetical protein J4H86_03090 [Spiractinospora alimapuensis]|uniref:hypothetical protein n=1 Tax=Spiractinospora alimapuensis TaxID=2820884 RepID=UPI001F2A9370|nr:hypothetical protein [Spiractinospora alimapuensis]QVQ52826.1 hypothetical protein J4H86_03090 [Spiractinospora alimapuensis]